MVIAALVLSILASIAAGASAIAAVLARGDARRSADAAERSAAAAEETAAYDKRAVEILEEQRADELEAAERASVVWHFQPVSGAIHRFVNHGDQTALDVRVRGDRVLDHVTNTTGEARSERVAPGEGVAFMVRGAMGMGVEATISWRREGSDLEHTFNTVVA